MLAAPTFIFFPTMPEAKSYHHGDLRSTVLRQAMEDLRTRPAQDLSIRDIAQRLGVSKAAPYRHFPSRLALLTAVRLEGFREFLAALCAVDPAHPDPIQALRELGAVYVRFAAAHPWLYRLLFSAQGLELADPEADRWGRACYDVLIQASHRAHATGWRRSQNPSWLAAALWAHVHGVASLRLEGLLPAPELDAEAYWDQLAGAMVDS
jgi:AcrR family transcriptional regulator